MKSNKPSFISARICVVRSSYLSTGTEALISEPLLEWGECKGLSRHLPCPVGLFWQLSGLSRKCCEVSQKYTAPSPRKLGAFHVAVRLETVLHPAFTL